MYVFVFDLTSQFKQTCFLLSLSTQLLITVLTSSASSIGKSIKSIQFSFLFLFFLETRMVVLADKIIFFQDNSSNKLQLIQAENKVIIKYIILFIYLFIVVFQKVYQSLNLNMWCYRDCVKEDYKQFQKTNGLTITFTLIFSLTR